MRSIFRSRHSGQDSASETGRSTSRAVIAAGLASVLAVASVLTAVSPATAATADGFEYTVLEGNDEVRIDSCDGSCHGSVTIPTTIAGLPVTEIADYAFDSEDLNNVSIDTESHVETIGEQAFYGNSLSAVYIPASVKTIEWAAFSNSGLANIQLSPSGNLETIGEQAFSWNDLDRVAIPESVKVVDGFAFAYNGITRLEFLPESQLEDLGDSAFAQNGLVSVTIPESVTEIGAQSFADNTGLYEVRFKGSKPNIGSGAFQNTGHQPIYYRDIDWVTGWEDMVSLNGRTVIGVPRPMITAQPRGGVLRVNGQVELTVTVDESIPGQGAVSYLWSKDHEPVEGASASSFDASSVGSYSVQVSSWAGYTLSNFANVSNPAPPAPSPPKPKPKPIVKKNQSVKLKLPSRLKRNKTYKLAKTSSAGAKVSWKVRGSGKCKIDKRKARIKCKVATGKRHVRIYGEVKGNSKYKPRKFHVNRRVR